MLRLGIAGIGAIAGDYIGLIVGGKVRDVALTALCSRNEAHIREAAQRHGLQAAAFTDYGAMLRSGQVDAILICTPHAQHPEMTRQALEAGLHVLVEKPVGIFADEVAEILPVLAERPELVCGVMYNRRAAQAYPQFFRIIAKQIIVDLFGDLLHPRAALQLPNRKVEEIQIPSVD